LFLDIIQIENTTAAQRNIFKELQTLYTNISDAKTNSFIDHVSISSSSKKENYKEYSVTFYLLPHQILIFPEAWRNALSVDELEEYLVYDNSALNNWLFSNNYLIYYASNNSELENEFNEFINQQEQPSNGDIVRKYLSEPFFGITWTQEQKTLIESQSKFDLKKHCVLKLSFTFDFEVMDAFSRSSDVNTFFADVALLSINNNTWQKKEISMNIENLNYNLLASSTSKMNTAFAKVLDTRVELIYQESWVGKYFNFEAKIDEGIVFFWNKTSKEICNSKRFKIYIFIPKLTKAFFFPLTYWKALFGRQLNIWFLTDLISKIKHGFLTKPYPATCSLFYLSPYFFQLKTHYSVPSNYLNFKDFYQSNTEQSVLAMVDFNEEKNILEAVFSPVLNLPNSFFLTNNVLEIRFFDSQNTLIAVNDYSQIFVVLKIIYKTK